MPQSALHSKVQKAWPEQRQSASCHFMPELRRMSKQHGIPLYEASCQIVVRHITPLIRIFPFRAELRHGQTVTHSALHRPPYIPADCKAERVPLSVCPADRCFFTHPGRFFNMLFAVICGRPFSCFKRRGSLCSSRIFLPPPFRFYCCKFSLSCLFPSF